MRLLFVSPHYGAVGGVRLIIDVLARAAREAGHEVAAVVDGDAFAFAGPAREVRPYPYPPRGGDVRRLQRFARKLPVTIARLRSAVRGLAPDVVSMHCVRRYAPYAAALRRLTGVPQVLSLQEAALPPGTPPQEGLFRMLVGAADVVAACSEEAAAYARRVAHATRTVVVPNGFDPAEFATDVVFAHPRPYVAGVGRLDHQKGFDLLLEAHARLPRDGVDLLLAGDGPARPALEAQAERLGTAGRVRLLGATDRPRTIALLRGAAAVACPSRFEGLPLVCVEALAAARPVVAAAVNGIPEVIRDGETGLLVPPDDAPALAAALGRLLEASEPGATLAQRGRALVEREYRWPDLAARYVALCSDIATDPGRADRSNGWIHS